MSSDSASGDDKEERLSKESLSKQSDSKEAHSKESDSKDTGSHGDEDDDGDDDDEDDDGDDSGAGAGARLLPREGDQREGDHNEALQGQQPHPESLLDYFRAEVETADSQSVSTLNIRGKGLNDEERLGIHEMIIQRGQEVLRDTQRLALILGAESGDYADGSGLGGLLEENVVEASNAVISSSNEPSDTSAQQTPPPALELAHLTGLGREALGVLVDGNAALAEEASKSRVGANSLGPPSNAAVDEDVRSDARSDVPVASPGPGGSDDDAPVNTVIPPSVLAVPQVQNDDADENILYPMSATDNLPNSATDNQEPACAADSTGDSHSVNVSNNSHSLPSQGSHSVSNSVSHSVSASVSHRLEQHVSELSVLQSVLEGQLEKAEQLEVRVEMDAVVDSNDKKVPTQTADLPTADLSLAEQQCLLLNLDGRSYPPVQIADSISLAPLMSGKEPSNINKPGPILDIPAEFAEFDSEDPLLLEGLSELENLLTNNGGAKKKTIAPIALPNKVQSPVKERKPDFNLGVPKTKFEMMMWSSSWKPETSSATGPVRASHAVAPAPSHTATKLPQTGLLSNTLNTSLNPSLNSHIEKRPAISPPIKARDTSSSIIDFVRQARGVKVQHPSSKECEEEAQRMARMTKKMNVVSGSSDVFGSGIDRVATRTSSILATSTSATNISMSSSSSSSAKAPTTLMEEQKRLLHLASTTTIPMGSVTIPPAASTSVGAPAIPTSMTASNNNIPPPAPVLVPKTPEAVEEPVSHTAIVELPSGVTYTVEAEGVSNGVSDAVSGNDVPAEFAGDTGGMD